jgi:callose synthase
VSIIFGDPFFPFSFGIIETQRSLTIFIYSFYYRDIRYFSGILSGLLSGFVTYVFLEPLFVPVGLDLAMVVLYVLSLSSAFVGMSLGVLLPTVFPGVVCGINLSLLIGSFLDLSMPLYFPITGGVLLLFGAFLSARYVS